MCVPVPLEITLCTIPGSRAAALTSFPPACSCASRSPPTSRSSRPPSRTATRSSRSRPRLRRWRVPWAIARGSRAQEKPARACSPRAGSTTWSPTRAKSWCVQLSFVSERVVDVGQHELTPIPAHAERHAVPLVRGPAHDSLRLVRGRHCRTTRRVRDAPQGEDDQDPRDRGREHAPGQEEGAFALDLSFLRSRLPGLTRSLLLDRLATSTSSGRRSPS